MKVTWYRYLLIHMLTATWLLLLRYGALVHRGAMCITGIHIQK